MEYISFVFDDVRDICFPTCVGLTAVYLPIFLLAIFKKFFTRISRWILTIPIVAYLLLLPMHPSVRSIPLMNMSIAGVAVYNAQKICEWILVRRDEFQQWSYFDVHHELFFYRVYTHPISLRKFGQRKKVLFYTGSINYEKHVRSLILLCCRIIRYYFLLDFLLFFLVQIFATDLYERYFLVRLLINPTSGWLVYFFLSIIYEITRFNLCLFYNRPLESIPDLFQAPYRAISPTDLWARWHQGFKQTWIELIFKPTCRFLQQYCPYLSPSIHSSIALMCVFLVSGLMHEYTAYVTFNQISGDQMKFFIFQGSAVLIEQICQRQFPQVFIPKSLSFLLTFLFNGITSGYFLKPWIAFFRPYPTLKYSFVDFLRRNLLNNKY